MVLFVLLLLHAITLAASPAVNESQPSLSVFDGIANDVWPFCFTPETHPGFRLTNSQDCMDALRELVREPSFLVPFQFSKNSRRGIKLPKSWRSGQCVIFVSCANDRDADTFTYAHVAQQARRVIQSCVDNTAAPYGGVEEIGNVGTFYVSVGRPALSRMSGILAEGVNGTIVMNATLSEA